MADAVSAHASEPAESFGVGVRLRWLYWRHGAWLPIALLVLAAAVFLMADAASLRGSSALVIVKPTAATQRQEPAQIESPDDVAARTLRAALLPGHQATEGVRRLVALTRPGLAWQRAEFQQTDEASIEAGRLQITVPVTGRYADVRQALDRALRETPNLSIDQVLLRRQSASETALEARVRLSLWLATAPSAESAVSAAKGARP